ncbi:MAG: SIS domain-containing protein [Burkholderiaceae bacterium]
MSGDPLSALYPFLHDVPQDAVALDAGLLASVRSKAEDSLAAKRAFFDSQAPGVVSFARALASVYRRAGRLYTAGNGGSSCDAAHIAVEFLHPVTTGRPALAATSLAGDVAMLTGVANDVGYRHVFVRQLIALARPGDALLVISTSGNSENLIAACAQARRMGMATLALSGGDGGALASSADVEHCLTVASDSIHRVQETHVAIYHIVWDLVHTLLAGTRGASPAAADRP